MIGCATHRHEPTLPTRYMALNLATRRDPTRTTSLRLRFIRQMNKRFEALKRDIRVSIVDRDCFAIQPRETIMFMQATPARAFEFQRTEAKIAGFMDWLDKQERLGILEQVYRPGLRPSVGAAWTDLYIDTAYRQGIRRGGQELRRAGYPVPDWEAVPGGIGAIMAQPIHAERIAVIYSRTFEDLKSVTQFTNAQVRRQITDGLTSGLARGLAEGKNPKVIARELYKDVANRVDKIGKVRARMIARTEIIRAHHVASIQEYRRAEVEGVIVDVEWLTGGNPCPICADMAAGGPYKLDVIEGMIPAHPNCVCATRPIPRVRGVS